MQRRNSAKPCGLDHRKSTTSIKSVQLVHIHPGTAERDAQVAASQAFSRARERSVTDAPMWPPPRGIDYIRIGRHNSTTDGRGNDPLIRRQQSVRFVKPKATHDKAIRGIAGEYTPSRPATASKSRVLENEIEHRHLNNASAAGMVSATKGATGNYINALITGEDYYTPEDDIASAPSSYRRLRRSKSMFTTSGISSLQGTQHGQLPCLTMQYSPNSKKYLPPFLADENVPPVGLKAPKSMSFLKTRQEKSYPNPARRGISPTPFTSYKEARLTNDRKRFDKVHSSILVQPKSTKPEKALRRTLRDISNSTMSIGPTVPKEGRLKEKARRVSHNFKHKLKNFFNIIKGENDETEFPPQQIEAQKTHVVEIDRPQNNMEDMSLDDAATIDAALSRVTSGVPSLHAVPSNRQLRSRQGSLETLDSELKVSDDQSRVTSWANSDSNTLPTMNSQRGELNLSVIKENCSHNPFPGREPVDNTQWTKHDVAVDALSIGKPALSPTIDGQRIYSALMKRVKDTHVQSHSTNMKRQQGVENFVLQGVVPERNSSRDREADEKYTPATIRHILPRCISETEISRVTSMSPLGYKGIERHPPLQSKNAADNMTILKETAKKNLGLSPSVNVAMFPTRQDSNSESLSTLSTRSLTNPYIADLPQPARILAARSSAFFGSPTCHLFRTKSPYRRAIQESMKGTASTFSPKSPELDSGTISLNNVPVRRPSTCESEVDKKMMYTESIYSCDDAEQMNGLNNTISLNERFRSPPIQHGDATIFLEPPSYLTPAPLTLPNRRVASSASSVEWKSWLSANVSKLEQSTLPIEPSSTNNDHAISNFPRGAEHVRENAQINEDEGSAEVTKKFESQAADCALAVNELNTGQPSYPARSLFKNKCSPTHFDKNNSFKKSPPPIPYKSTLRLATSIASMRYRKDICQSSVDSLERETCNHTQRKPPSHTYSTNALSTKVQNGASATTKIAKKQPRPKSGATSPSSLSIGAAVDQNSGNLAGSVNCTSRAPRAGPIKSENVSPRTETATGPFGVQDSGIFGLDMDLNPPDMGSKRMVDIFLNSRRKRIMGTSVDGDAFL